MDTRDVPLEGLSQPWLLPQTLPLTLAFHALTLAAPTLPQTDATCDNTSTLVVISAVTDDSHAKPVAAPLLATRLSGTGANLSRTCAPHTQKTVAASSHVIRMAARTSANLSRTCA